jgi:ATPase family associated with various cellular activities (AAA)
MSSAREFGASFKGFLDQMAAQAPADEPALLKRLREHLGAPPPTLPIVAESFEAYDHANLQMALEALLDQDGCSAQVIGVTDQNKRFMGMSLSQLVAPSGRGLMGEAGPAEGPVEYTNIELDQGRVVTCTQSGLYLVQRGEQRWVVLVQGPVRQHYQGDIQVEVIAQDRALAEKFLAGLRTAMRRRNVYRGQVLSLHLNERRALRISFHRLPAIQREAIILPDGLLERIERQTVGFSKHAAKLAAAGRHLKRGLLLHGPPGTGKTLTAMYLAKEMKDRTVLLMTGPGQGMIAQSCALARALQPSTVVLEDVDLIAESRDHRELGCTGPLLFELLNQMDGLAEDADVLFVLTTNRPDILEPALAARPGRIDQAIQVPLPDAGCRRRLFQLYGRGLTLKVPDWEPLIQRTEGASAAFIRELMRKAALFAADEGGEMVVGSTHLDEALRELTVLVGELTQSLLGFASRRSGDT